MGRLLTCLTTGFFTLCVASIIYHIVVRVQKYKDRKIYTEVTRDQTKTTEYPTPLITFCPSRDSIEWRKQKGMKDVCLIKFRDTCQYNTTHGDNDQQQQQGFPLPAETETRNVHMETPLAALPVGVPAGIERVKRSSMPFDYFDNQKDNPLSMEMDKLQHNGQEEIILNSIHWGLDELINEVSIQDSRYAQTSLDLNATFTQHKYGHFDGVCYTFHVPDNLNTDTAQVYFYLRNYTKEMIQDEEYVGKAGSINQDWGTVIIHDKSATVVPTPDDWQMRKLSYIHDTQITLSYMQNIRMDNQSGGNCTTGNDPGLADLLEACCAWETGNPWYRCASYFSPCREFKNVSVCLFTNLDHSSEHGTCNLLEPIHIDKLKIFKDLVSQKAMCLETVHFIDQVKEVPAGWSYTNTITLAVSFNSDKKEIRREKWSDDIYHVMCDVGGIAGLAVTAMVFWSLLFYGFPLAVRNLKRKNNNIHELKSKNIVKVLGTDP